MSKDVFVVRHGDGWGVRTAGAGRVAKSFETKAPAFEYGRSMAKANQAELHVQNRNGQFGPCNSYSGHDPRPPRPSRSSTAMSRLTRPLSSFPYLPPRRKFARAFAEE